MKSSLVELEKLLCPEVVSRAEIIEGSRKKS